MGGEGGMEARLVKRADIPFKAIPAAGLHGVGLLKIPGSLLALSRGLRAASRIVKDYRPHVLFFTGGYVAVPMAIAGYKTPALLYVPDIEPGLALKTLAYFAKKIAVTNEDSKQYFSQHAKIVVTGYPIRTEITNWTRTMGREHLGLVSGLPVVLVFGGSKGAHSINTALCEHLNALLEHMEVLHISGELDWPFVNSMRETLSKEKAARYHVYPYLHEDMGAALAVADLAVSRAGASVMGEFPQFGIPAILVPYPHAWRYQMVNASMLAKRGAALMIEDARLKSGLYLTIEKLLETPEKLDEMRKAMFNLRTPNAAEKIADQLYGIGGDAQ